ncbi:DUF4235 domain-containing protein [Streptomyces sp. NPDC049040]|uniref:DUF4235 domain-containing protein n=1 Tax=Streptomyces sp. NPDC049040 TaxID=3365593 RepID=UPI00372477E6
MKSTGLAYKPVGWAIGAASGAVAGLLFRKAWTLITDDDDAPDATDEDRSWQEILLAAAMQGALFAVVKAAVDRGGAHLVKHVTGSWPE